MDSTTVLAQLEALGTAQNRKIYRRHGAADPMFGVSYAELGKLKKKIKTDQALARELWASGIHDARVLATMIADPAAADADMLESWARDATNQALTYALAEVAACSPAAWSLMERWMVAGDEWRGSTGWEVLSRLVNQEATGAEAADSSPDSSWEPFLEVIEREIHGSPNRVRYAMNGALISIGSRSDALAAKATAAAARIGRVEVDHGETGCKTPDAASYIRKTREHRTKKAAGKAGR